MDPWLTLTLFRLLEGYHQPSTSLKRGIGATRYSVLLCPYYFQICYCSSRKSQTNFPVCCLFYNLSQFVIFQTFRMTLTTRHHILLKHLRFAEVIRSIKIGVGKWGTDTFLDAKNRFIEMRIPNTIWNIFSALQKPGIKLFPSRSTQIKSKSEKIMEQIQAKSELRS